MRRVIIALLSFCSFFSVYSQQKVNFYAEDSLKITADLYIRDLNLPFIILFHQGDASRGEYSEIAPKLVKLDYNCLAVDLRYGGKINYTINETAELAMQGNFDHTMLSAAKDIKAALSFVKRYNKKPIILVGSSYSASLCLLEAAGNEKIKAVVAMSPGEYFRPGLIVRDNITGISQKLFISATALEYDFIDEMLIHVPRENVHFFQPSGNRGDHGAKMLWQSGDSADQCWLELLFFFKKIRY